MPVIGTFTPVEDGYTGSITTLSLNAPVAILPNAAKQGRNAPDFLIVAGSVEIGAAYSFAKARSEDLGPDPIDRFPAHRAEAWLQVTPIERVGLRVRGRYAGEAVDRGEPTPAYATVDATASAQIGGWLGVLRCEDLLDEQPETRTGYSMPGRVFSLVVQRTWD